MRIAQIAPFHEAVPPALHGDTERVVLFLTEELAALGHDVTLFASGDSRTGGTLAGEFDILHFHMDYWPLSLFTRPPGPQGRRNRLSSAKACQRRPVRQASIEAIMPDLAERMPPKPEDRPGFMGGG